MADLSPPPHQPNVPQAESFRTIDPMRPARPQIGPAPAAAPAPPALPEAGPDEVAMIIDDRPVVAKKGTTVLQAAEKAGILVPHYCYHPGLSIAGNCRMCLVEIEKMPKLQIACATLSAPGMIVRTSNDRVREVRAGIQEFLLINHPLDCPICDEAGECRLQSYEAAYGRGASRFGEEKVHAPKRSDIGERVVFDAERCIKCTRCIRFCDEVSGTRELGLFQRGDHTIVGAFPGKPLNNVYSGNTVDVCPVGALTWKPFRFKTRVWFLKNVPSVCTSCARGCNVDVATFRNRMQRMVPRANPEVNRYWMCDIGRESYAVPYARPRLERPRLRAPAVGGPASDAASWTDLAGADVAARWDKALDRGADLLRGIVSRHGAQALAAVVSARGTVEDLHLAKQVLGRLVGIPRLAVPAHEEGQDDHLLLRRDRTANARGAEALGLGAPSSGRVREVLEDAASGRVRGLVVVGEDLAALPGFTPEVFDRLEGLIVIDWWASPTAERANVVFPSCAYGEHEGTVVNFQGRVQRLREAIRPHMEADPAWRILTDLGRRFGLPNEYATAAAVFDDVAASVGAFAGLSYASLGELGAPLAQAEPRRPATPAGD